MENEDNDKFVEIDVNRLDEEWVNQPKLYHKWAKKLAEARRDFDEAKANLELVDAELDREIRSDPVKFEIGKITEGALEKCIAIQDSHIKANNRLIDCKYTVNVLEAAIGALDHKKRALENLVQLHGRDYFSTPTASKETRDNTEQMEKRSARAKGVRKVISNKE